MGFIKKVAMTLESGTHGNFTSKFTVSPAGPKLYNLEVMKLELPTLTKKECEGPTVTIQLSEDELMHLGECFEEFINMGHTSKEGT